MTQSAVDALVPLSLETCVTQLRYRSAQLTKQHEQQRRKREWYTLKIVSVGKDIYDVQLSSTFGIFIGAKLNARLQKVDKNQTRVTGTTHLGRFAKSWAVFISAVMVIYLLAGVENAWSPRWLILMFLGFVSGLGPLYAAHLMKKDLINLFQHWLKPPLGDKSSR